MARLVRIRLTMPLPTPKSDATSSRGNRLLSAMRTAPRLNSSVCLITSSVSLNEHYALKRPARKRYNSRSPSRPSRNGPADAATRYCVSNPAICAFTSRRVDVQSSNVVSIDGPVTHGVLPWRPIDSKFHRLYNFMLSRFLISKAAITASYGKTAPIILATFSGSSSSMLIATSGVTLYPIVVPVRSKVTVTSRYPSPVRTAAMPPVVGT